MIKAGSKWLQGRREAERGGRLVPAAPSLGLTKASVIQFRNLLRLPPVLVAEVAEVAGDADSPPLLGASSASTT